MKKLSWPIKVFFITFILAAVFSGVTNLIANMNIISLSIILLIVIFIGVIFDMIGVAALTSKKENFHAMASKKIKGSKEAIEILKHADMFATICNDIVGDISGILSGGFGAVLAINLSTIVNISPVTSTIIISALISSLTVGGKSIFKNIAVKNANSIILFVAKVKSMLSFK